jgi:uncharacterized membrane protein YphA (DoxX/SURF4 family)
LGREQVVICELIAPVATLNGLKVEPASALGGIVLMQSHASIPITKNTATAAVNKAILPV